MKARIAGKARIESYKGPGGKWFWRLQAQNGRILVTSVHGADRERDIPRAVVAARRALQALVVTR